MPFETYSKRLKRLAQQGEPTLYEYDSIPQQFRVQVVYIMKGSIGQYVRNISMALEESYGSSISNRDWRYLHNTLAEEEGVFKLGQLTDDPETALLNWFLNGTTENALDTIELVFRWIDNFIRETGHFRDSRYGSISMKPDTAISNLNQRFREHRIGFEYIDGELIRKDSEYLHEEAVKPALTLLGDPGFSGPQAEFLDAHEHLRLGEHEDAIVGAGKAFESTMKAICDLRTLTYDNTATARALIKIMFDEGVIPLSLSSHFSHLQGVLEAGLPTVRNKNGAHGAGSVPALVPEYMAAYALHLAASNIVLLVEAHKAKP